MIKYYTITREQFLEVLRYTHYTKPIEDLNRSKKIHILMSLSFISISIIVFYFASTVVPSVMFFSMALFSAVTASYKYYRYIKLYQELEEWTQTIETMDLDVNNIVS
ncbi:MAG TPA: hypothetical protein VMX17_04705 [Candidatus Glassbacteria bacterium]|nr:hypothetical protein [Candidatus Glassbacteria bacterium]